MLGLRRVGPSISVGGVGGATGYRAVVNLEFEGKIFRNFPVLVIQSRIPPLIGRDILNRHVLLCDGPAQVFTVS
jgi:hypothetical protein